MDKDNQLLTTREFASRTGLQAAKVSKLIRQGKIEAKKTSGKWLIHPTQLQAKAIQGSDKGGKSTAKKKTVRTSHKKTVTSATKEIENSTGRAYTVSEFVEMTYLTELGVRQWLKQGRLIGQQNEKGDWLIDAANLQEPNIKRLLREVKVP